MKIDFYTSWFLRCIFALLVSGGLTKASTAASSEQSSSWEISIIPSVPSGVAFVGERAEYRVVVRNLKNLHRTVSLMTAIQAPGEKPRYENWSLSFGGGSTDPIEKSLVLSTEKRGYWSLLVTLSDSGEHELVRKQSALAVVAKPHNYGQTDTRSFFGSMFNHDPEAGQRIGIKFERQMAPWEWLAPTENSYSWEHRDAHFAKMEKHGVSTVLVIRPELPPKWAKWKSLEELTKPEFLPYYVKFVRDVTEHYKDRVAAIELINEPDLDCARGMSGEMTTAQVYEKLLEAGYAAVKSVAPKLPVIGLDVSGVDFPNLRFSEAVLAGVKSKSMDIMGGHPYTSARYIGGGSTANSPDSIDTVGRFASMATLMEKHGIRPRVWSTEFGWALHKDELMGASAAELLGAYVAQSLSLARSVPEVEKLFWFSFYYPGYEAKAFTYSLFQGVVPGPLYPTPGAVTYATCARFLDDVHFLRQFPLGRSGKVLRFADNRTGDGVFVLWLSDPGSVGGALKVSLSDVVFEGLAMNDGYGRPVTGDPVIRVLPLFVTVPGQEADRLEKVFRSAHLGALETLLIERVYLSGPDQVKMDVINNGDAPLAVKLFPKNESDRALSQSLPTGASAIDLNLKAPLAEKGEVSLQLLEERSGKVREFSLPYDITRLAWLPNVKIDGRLEETRALKGTVLDSRDKVLPADPGVDWNGPTDLSMKVWVGSTNEGLYLAVEVTDDVATTSQSGGALFWEKDSLQIAWDMGNRAGGGYDSHCLELGAYATSGGVEVLETYPDAALRGDISIAGRREGVATFYEMVVPWRALVPDGAAPPRVFRMNIIANDNDGLHRKCWLGLTPGIGEGKRPSAFRQWAPETAGRSN